MELYFIGNGFDIYHGLPTRYTNFIEYMKRNFPQEYQWLYKSINKYSLDYWDVIGKGEDNIIWNDMENILGSFEPLDLLEEQRDWNSPIDYKGPPCEELQHLLNFGFNVNFYLHRWIGEVDNSIQPSLRRKWIDNLFGKDECTILSFNYTLTIEKLYNKTVFHIHGKGKERLIMGHANPEGGDIQGTDFGINVINQKYVKKYFRTTSKNPQKIIKRHAEFFSKENLAAIRKVYIMGHSLNNIDMPYIEALIESMCDLVKWIIVYYDESNKEYYDKIANEIFDTSEKYELISWDNIEKQFI